MPTVQVGGAWPVLLTTPLDLGLAAAAFSRARERFSGWLRIPQKHAYNEGMNKTEAIRLLGGNVSAAAKAIGISYQAVLIWPDPLPRRIADRVQAALWRVSQGIPHPPQHPAKGEEREEELA